MTIKEQYKIINSGKVTTLKSLILSREVENANIEIYDHNGNFKCKGKWYHDTILNYEECWGKAFKSGTGLTVKFELI
jgi:hypothetical protein|nr:MAG TPA: hypothetical protein [Caudoviricetes sp.]